MRPLTLNDFYDAEGSMLMLTDPDPEDAPLPLDGLGGTSTEEKLMVEANEGVTDSIDMELRPICDDEHVDETGDPH